MSTKTIVKCKWYIYWFYQYQVLELFSWWFCSDWVASRCSCHAHKGGQKSFSLQLSEPPPRWEEKAWTFHYWDSEIHQECNTRFYFGYKWIGAFFWRHCFILGDFLSSLKIQYSFWQFTIKIYKIKIMENLKFNSCLIEAVQKITWGVPSKCPSLRIFQTAAFKLCHHCHQSI